MFTREGIPVHGLFRRRNLPHLDVPGGTYFVTFCLAGSLPTRGGAPQAGAVPDRAGDAAVPCGLTGAFATFDRMLDSASSVRWLADRRLADVLRESLLHRHGSHYDLLAYVVMPSHCHLVFTPLTDIIGGRPAREAVLRSLKRRSAHRCNRILGRRGPFWQAESYDRVVRGGDALRAIIDYVEFNPVTAGLCKSPEAWEFSSAHRRLRALGERATREMPLLKAEMPVVDAAPTHPVSLEVQVVQPAPVRPRSAG